MIDPDEGSEGATAVPINENLFIDDDEDLSDLDEALDDLDLEQWPWWQAKSGLGCTLFVGCVLVRLNMVFKLLTSSVSKTLSVDRNWNDI